MIFKFYKKIALISPFFEIILRVFYWNNVRILKYINPYQSSKIDRKRSKEIDFSKILNWLKLKGVQKGDVLIVHSSYDGLNQTFLSPDQIIDSLLDLIGPQGTLVMPIIRRYDTCKINKHNKFDSGNEINKYIYDVRRSPITSGLLPFRLMKRKNSFVSYHPLNPICAVGFLAKEMTENNIEGDLPSPHGKNSAWRFCYDKGAKIVGLGLNIEHHNTMIHVSEESFGDWPISDNIWYNTKEFDIVDRNNILLIKKVRERKERWGRYFFTEIRLNNDLKKLNIMQTDKIESEIEVGFIDSNALISFLRSKKESCYPYYIPFKCLKSKL